MVWENRNEKLQLPNKIGPNRVLLGAWMEDDKGDL